LYTQKGEVTGAVLLHTPKSELSEAFDNGIFILFISIILAFAIGILISIIISRTIAKPLKKINKTALQISEGNYAAKTDVKGTDEIGELAQTMDEMGDKLRQAEIESEKLQKMRQDFVANISHELRTPVTVIRGSLEAICDKVVTEPEMVEEYHRQLLGESIYMQRLVNDLLDLSRLQNPDFSINITEFNLCDCISDAVRSGRRIAVDKNINIEFSSDENVYMIKGDYDRIRQMLLIIIDNAIKFTDNPENAVGIELKENTVSVTNIGVGINKEDLPMVFERFYKSRSEKNKNGTGLGLAIAKQIATRHDIDVSVSSVEGGETTFRFVFPPKM
jgi:signal transduction histidine kinase